MQGTRLEEVALKPSFQDAVDTTYEILSLISSLTLGRSELFATPISPNPDAPLHLIPASLSWPLIQTSLEFDHISYLPRTMFFCVLEDVDLRLNPTPVIVIS